ncbi:MAG: hypothetical protein QM628_15725 [Propionicimonas sp.]
MSDQTPSLPGCQLEYLDPAQLGVSPSNPVATELMVACVGLLSQCAVEPGRCRLIITGDFVESVRQRLPEGEYRDTYGVDRGTGVVGGKTMQMPDRTLDVLVADMLFQTGKTPAQQESARNTALHTVFHEGQHVAMMQAGETDPDLSGLPRGRQYLETLADLVIQEYRAERAVALAGLTAGNEWDLAAEVKRWRDALARIACVEYQEHLDVLRLWHGVLQESNIVWKLLAYVAGRIPDGSSTKHTPSKAVRGDHLWRRMIKPHWRQFIDILRQVPPGDVPTTQADLAEARRLLADEFGAWLLTLGFEAVDGDDGFAFYVRDWGLLAG